MNLRKYMILCTFKYFAKICSIIIVIRIFICSLHIKPFSRIFSVHLLMHIIKDFVTFYAKYQGCIQNCEFLLKLHTILHVFYAHERRWQWCWHKNAINRQQIVNYIFVEQESVSDMTSDMQRIDRETSEFEV